MCGRFGLRTDPRRFVERHLNARAPENYAFVPHSNIAPTTNVLAVPNTPERELTEMRWSLVPRYARDPQASRLATFNARVESLAHSKIYAPLLPARRAVVPADGYYEWRRNADGSKTPVWIFRRDGELLLLAALWDVREGRGGRPPLFSLSIVTKPQVEELESVHDRMPVSLSLELAERWLAPEELAPRDAVDLLVPAEPRSLAYHAVSRRVGNVRNDDEDLTAPVPDEPEPARAKPTKPSKRDPGDQPRLF